MRIQSLVSYKTKAPNTVFFVMFMKLQKVNRQNSDLIIIDKKQNNMFYYVYVFLRIYVSYL